MAKTKVRNKKYNPRPEGTTYTEKDILYSPEDSFLFTLQIYYRLWRFKKNVAVSADRTTLMIRLYGALGIIDDFHHEEGDSILQTAIDILKGCRDHVTKSLRQLTTDEIAKLSAAVVLSDNMFQQSSNWQEIAASKIGEDRCIIGADKYEYRFKSVVD